MSAAQFDLCPDYARLAEWRWPSGQPECPDCGSHHLYWMDRRKQFHCANCTRHFSMTSGTIFANHKIPVSALLDAYDAVRESPDIAATDLMRRAGLSYKGAHYLATRIKDSL